MRTVFGLDAHVYVEWVSTIRAVGLSTLRRRPASVATVRDRDRVNAIIDSRFWPSPNVVWTDGQVQREGGEAVPIRVYRKRGSTSRAVIVYAHGGGSISGSLDIYDRRCAAYVEATGIPLISVGYGLAPENPFPRAHLEVLAVVRDVQENSEQWGVDRRRIGIAGDSAGGGIAAGVALQLRDEATADSPRLACQLLIYPWLDDRNLSPDPADPNTRSRWISWSYAENAVAWASYLGHEGGQGGVSPYAAPARATDLAGLPPTYISVGTLDILRREDEVYTSRLRAAGVPVDFRLVQSVQHGFDVFAPKAPVTIREWQARFAFLSQHLEER